MNELINEWNTWTICKDESTESLDILDKKSYHVYLCLNSFNKIFLKNNFCSINHVQMIGWVFFVNFQSQFWSTLNFRLKNLILIKV